MEYRNDSTQNEAGLRYGHQSMGQVVPQLWDLPVCSQESRARRLSGSCVGTGPGAPAGIHTHKVYGLKPLG